MKLLPKLLDEHCVFLKVCWNIGKSSTLAGVSSCVSLRYFNLAKEHHPCLKFEGFTDQKEPFQMATSDYQRLNPQDVAPTVLSWSIGWSSPLQYKYSHHQSEIVWVTLLRNQLSALQDGKVTMEELYEALKDHLDQVPEALDRDRDGSPWGPKFVMVMMVIPRKPNPNPNHPVFLQGGAP